MARRIRRPSWWAVVMAVIVGLAGLAWWTYTGNERHIDDLLDTAYVYSGFPGEPDLHHLHYKRRHLGNGCFNSPGDWVGVKAASRDDPVIGLSGAEIAAVRYEAEGWNVFRQQINPLVSKEPTRSIEAWRGEDQISIFYYEGAISVSARSGPCNINNPPSFDPDGDWVEVDHFDD